jgi:hypothetical protein
MLAPQLRGTGAEIGLWSDVTAGTPMRSGVRRTGEQRRQRNLAACATTALPLRAPAFHRAARVCAQACVCDCTPTDHCCCGDASHMLDVASCISPHRCIASHRILHGAHRTVHLGCAMFHSA